jgi:glycosyltransferase involved in cell wall biosynthesis
MDCAMKDRTPAPIGVLMPTLNCASLLPAHIESMRCWLDFVSEIVVVDSYSDDGSLELIQKLVRHPALRIIQHPRGLYQSWNFGISQITSKYTYVSTVGDSISRTGLEHLFAVAENLECDGVISKPRSITNDDAPINDASSWPVHDVITSLNINKPTPVAALELFFFALLHVPNGILGSSAGNLYRTEILQRFPFPADFGITGDGAWALANLFDCRFAVTPEIFSTFRHHPKAYSAKTYAVEDLSGKLFKSARASFEQRLAADAVLRTKAVQLGFDRFLDCAGEYFKWRWRLEVERSRKWPWVFNPRAWRARSGKKHFHRLLQEHKKTVVKSFIAA